MELTMQQREAARASLAARREERLAVLEELIAAGVQVMSEDIYVERGVQVAPGATLLPGTILRGKTIVAEGCVIGPNTLLENAVVGKNTTVNASQVYDSTLGENNKIGPYTHVRKDTVTGYGVHLGAYVETKNSNFAMGNTVSHLTYIGDSDVGKYCNFGCGTVTCNYDGENKFRTTIGDYVFVGCNTNLVAPVTVGDGAYTAAGSTITKDVPAGDMGIARERQTNLEGWAKPKMQAYIAKKQKLEAESK
ncbi:MAG: UDP-N-acetylglucosamine diphosphorylase [Subdoligranulum sp.]|nr:UDP-N-acetylglucosamine diphosphorylase [Subdoligranulum sp.]MDD7264803.1 UDP-N-acetylglucosamine diphosphorylase [Subdoligranulum sp.]MDY5923720.1 UDP-N-acetylglucosamine diphosphorylase [Oscillospiraceae bacterium]